MMKRNKKTRKKKEDKGSSSSSSSSSRSFKKLWGRPCLWRPKKGSGSFSYSSGYSMCFILQTYARTAYRHVRQQIKSRRIPGESGLVCWSYALCCRIRTLHIYTRCLDVRATTCGSVRICWGKNSKHSTRIRLEFILSPDMLMCHYWICIQYVTLHCNSVKNRKELLMNRIDKMGLFDNVSLIFFPNRILQAHVA